MNHRILNQNPRMPITVQFGASTTVSYQLEQGEVSLWIVATMLTRPDRAEVSWHYAVMDDYGTLTRVPKEQLKFSLAASRVFP